VPPPSPLVLRKVRMGKGLGVECDVGISEVVNQWMGGFGEGLACVGWKSKCGFCSVSSFEFASFELRQLQRQMRF
jgi:hypothetical protein